MTFEIWFWLKKYVGKTQVKVQVQFSTLTLEGEDKIEAYSKIDQNPDTWLKTSLDLESRLNVGIMADLVITWGATQNQKKTWG